MTTDEFETNRLLLSTMTHSHSNRRLSLLPIAWEMVILNLNCHLKFKVEYKKKSNISDIADSFSYWQRFFVTFHLNIACQALHVHSHCSSSKIRRTLTFSVFFLKMSFGVSENPLSWFCTYLADVLNGSQISTAQCPIRSICNVCTSSGFFL